MADISSWNIHGTAYDVADSQARANFADAYDSSATYAVGDYCTQYGRLYVCNTEISTPEAWTAAHWTATTVMAAIAAMFVNEGDPVT
jgi:hypothetical protein